MASAKSGTAIEPEAPEEPAEAQDAAESDATEVSTAEARSRQREAGTVDSTQVDPAAADSNPPPEEVEDHWIGVELVDEDGKPVPDEPYKVKLPDGTIQSGRLDEKGRARIEGITESGQAQISFPGLHGDEWKAV